MFQPERVRAHMPVAGQDDQPVGNVDRLEGSAIKLTRDAQGPAPLDSDHVGQFR
jgi:hypothetical protein